MRIAQTREVRDRVHGAVDVQAKKIQRLRPQDRLSELVESPQRSP